MENSERKQHWENIYQTRKLTEVSWHQPIPSTSLSFFAEYNVPKNAKIIDIGGGDSFLTDHLLDLGYTDITILDISQAAIDRAKARLGTRAENVKWIIADAATFSPTEKYDFWHDRAAFHFLTGENEILNYLTTAKKNINPEGLFVLGTFSEEGPKKCSGINIKQYSETTMTELIGTFFEKKKCLTTNHQTPSGSIQNFVFCVFGQQA